MTNRRHYINADVHVSCHITAMFRVRVAYRHFFASLLPFDTSTAHTMQCTAYAYLLVRCSCVLVSFLFSAYSFISLLHVHESLKSASRMTSLSARGVHGPTQETSLLLTRNDEAPNIQSIYPFFFSFLPVFWLLDRE